MFVVFTTLPAMSCPPPALIAPANSCKLIFSENVEVNILSIVPDFVGKPYAIDVSHRGLLTVYIFTP